ncbi:hypothetical protein DDZ13_06545 [Coraliomargarita sinensis]|uniref:Uncharacterized protein n=1 Tax=Coraliomargarita sinensis TaxID=2174842 RepID=A0A317ZLX4_9BACT|nr:hypothetical protein [Coraliomargarita sinensis]PXA04819.1 hypothetical protein DDZ13_06545 [Coraliomargarita sinensis]
MPRKRLFDLLGEIPVDPRTLEKAVRESGIRITRVGRSGPLVSQEDFERIQREGIPYYKDKITTEGIR